MAAHTNPLDRPVATRGRIALYFAVRYATPMMVLLALAASGDQPAMDRLAGLLTAQVMAAAASHALALRGTAQMNVAVWIGMLADLVAISMLVAMTGGPAGPLSFLFSVQALAAGILLSSRAGLRMLVLSTASILLMDIVAAATPLESGDPLPAGFVTVAILWIVGGAGTLFSTYNEHELRRRNAELATIRQVTLDIEESLTLEEIFQDLCSGVCRGFRFDGAAVLLRDGQQMRCVAAHGVTGTRDTPIALAGRLAHALALAAPVVTSGAQARQDGLLLPLIGARGYLAVPIAEDGLLVATRDGRKGRAGVLRAHEIEALDRLAHHARLAIANARLHARVQAMAITDSLTGLVNHGEMQRQLAAETGRIARYRAPNGAGHALSLIMLDIDGFKTFNDRYGHPAGDAVLRGVAAALTQTVRSFDIVARYGGEEFGVILPETTVESAMTVAERVRKAVAAYPFATNGAKPVKVTVSIGVATAPANGTTPGDLIRAADTALYVAKDTGRNRVVHALDLAEGTNVLSLEPRRRRGPVEGPVHGASRRVRARSSRPTRRTPPA